jgi:DNA-binding transcriptional MocR family regulator
MARAPYVSFAVRSNDSAGFAASRRVFAEDVVRVVTADVLAGRLPPGSRLPPVRVLEQQLGVSKNTVQSAYDELVARGILETRERAGVFVLGPAAGVPEASRIASPPPMRVRPAPPLHSGKIPRDAISLSTVFVDPELLPREKLSDCARSVLRSPGLESFYDVLGYGPLRELIAARLRARGMSDVTAANVLVTTGSQQAIDVVARTLEVRRVAVESPVYPGAKLLFESHGLAVTGLRLDPFAGIPLDAWEDALARARPGVLYAITSYQNPTGYSYTSHELATLIAMAERHGVALVEDDWGSDMLSGSEYRPTLRFLGGPNVVYINSFTKKLLPSLRVGFLVAEGSVMPSLVAAKRLSTLGNPWLTEAVLAEFLDRGYYDAHLAALQRELDVRYARCLDLLNETMPQGVRWTTPGGGPTLWLEVPRAVDLAELRGRLAERGVVVESSDSGFDGPPHLHGFRISYAFLPPATLERALRIVGDALREVNA